MINFLDVIEEKEKRELEIQKEKSLLEDIRKADFPYIEPYLDLNITNFYGYDWNDYTNLNFGFKDQKLSLDEKEDFAINFIDELGGAPEPTVYGGSDEPWYTISNHHPVMLNGHKIKLSFNLGNEVPKAYKVKKVHKTKDYDECEVSCVNGK